MIFISNYHEHLNILSLIYPAKPSNKIHGVKLFPERIPKTIFLVHFSSQVRDHGIHCIHSIEVRTKYEINWFQNLFRVLVFQDFRIFLKKFPFNIRPNTETGPKSDIKAESGFCRISGRLLVYSTVRRLLNCCHRNSRL